MLKNNLEMKLIYKSYQIKHSPIYIFEVQM